LVAPMCWYIWTLAIITTFSPLLYELMPVVRFYQHLLEQLHQGPVVLATVIATQGQVPQTVGDKLLIWGAAETYGDWADSTDKVTLMTQSIEVLKTGMPQRLQLPPSTDEPATGVMQVWLSRWQGPSALEAAKQIIDALANPSDSRLIMPLVAGQLPYVVSQEQLSLKNFQGQETFIEPLQ
jgi:xanthine/CO dehydrogenase XdhC/CoxF family maturation factor